MGRGYRWLGSILLTIANIGLLLLTYFSLTNSGNRALILIQTESVAPERSSVLSGAPTATPIPLVRVLQALQNLPRGYRFPNRIYELENIVGYATFPESTVPFNAMREYDGGIEKVLGKIARTDIFREQPILSTYLITDLNSLASVGSDLAAILPSDRVAKSIRLMRKDFILGLSAGDHVNIFYTKVNNSTTETSATTALLVDNALVLFVGEMPSNWRISSLPTPTPVPYEYTNNSSFSNATITPSPTMDVEDTITVVLGVTNQSAGELIWAEQQNIHLSLVVRSVNDRSTTNVNPIR